MTTIELQIPDKYTTFLEDSSDLQKIMTELIYDFVEVKQDIQTKNNLDSNLFFHTLNSNLEEKLYMH